MSRLTIVVWIAGVLLALGATTPVARASDPTTNLEQATELVGRALQAEMDEDVLGRDRLLTEAQQVESQFAPAHWYRGQVQDSENQWLSVDQAIEQAKSIKLLTEYETFRATLPASVAGNWQAAQWCAKNQLPEQCRAHLMNILLIDPDHVGARKALGHQQVDHDWLSIEDQQRLQERAEFSQAGFAKY